VLRRGDFFQSIPIDLTTEGY
jgi:hypothetical protein